MAPCEAHGPDDRALGSSISKHLLRACIWGWKYKEVGKLDPNPQEGPWQSSVPPQKYRDKQDTWRVAICSSSPKDQVIGSGRWIREGGAGPVCGGKPLLAA